MRDIWPTMLAVMLANLMTIIFLWGLSRASKIYDDRNLDWQTAVAIMLPMFFLSGGLYLYL